MAAAPEPTPQPPSRLAEVVGVLLLFLVLAGGALAFAWTWLPGQPPGGPGVARYAPLRDGDAQLVAKYDAAGAVRGWESQNSVLVATTGLFVGEVRQAPLEAILEFLKRPDEPEIPIAELTTRLAEVQVYRVRVRELDADGAIVERTTVVLRDARGSFLVGTGGSGGADDVVFEPPLQQLPPDLEPGRTWSSEGQIAGSLPYRLEGRVIEAGPLRSALGEFDDCLLVESRFERGPPDRTLNQTTREWYCAGVGSVETEELDPNGMPGARTILVGTDRRPAASESQPPIAVPTPPAISPEAESIEDWSLTRIGRARRSSVTTRSTISPIWIPGDPPALLAASFGGELVAFDATDPTGSILWRFRAEGNVYGAPGYDAVRHRIYFGATDKRLYALDARGLFLWSFLTGDNVASRPLVVDDTVIFGGEDRTVYGLDAASGALRWTAPTGGSIVSSPVLAIHGGDESEQASVVVIGSDDGGVYGLDPVSGEQRWVYAARGPIEAPIVAADGSMYAVSRAGSVTALDPATGDVVWESTLPSRDVLRTAPAVGAERVFVVDDTGRLTVFDRADGRRLMSSAEAIYIGPPVLVGDSVVLAGKDTNVYRLDLDGAAMEQWPWSSARSVADGSQAPLAQVGLSAGGGALWLADNNAVVRRLGPRQSGLSRPALLWLRTATESPFSNSFISAPASYGDRAVLVDGFGTAYLVDPASGAATRLGRIGDGPALSQIAPVVVGDMLLTILGDTLHATSLVDGTPYWQTRGEGASFHPVSVVDDTVLWLQRQPSVTASNGTLSALDLNDGAVRWQAPLGEQGFTGGVVADATTVYTSTPPAAFDLRTGEPRWQLEDSNLGIGGPVLTDDGQTFFVGLAGAGGSAVAAVATVDGRERWRADLSEETVRFREALWLSGGTLIVPAFSGTIVGLDTASGVRRWQYTPPQARFGGITVADGRVWMMLEDAKILALDAATGDLLGRSGDLELSLANPGGHQPLVIGDRLVVPYGFQLAGFSARTDP